MKRNKKNGITINNGSVQKALKKHREKMEAEGKLKPEKKKKILHPLLINRKDGLPTCYVCGNKLEELRELQELKREGRYGTDHYNKLQVVVSAKVTSIGKMGREHNLYRCTTCEPGSPKYMRNTYLRKIHEEFVG